MTIDMIRSLRTWHYPSYIGKAIHAGLKPARHPSLEATTLRCRLEMRATNTFRAALSAEFVFAALECPTVDGLILKTDLVCEE